MTFCNSRRLRRSSRCNDCRKKRKPSRVVSIAILYTLASVILIIWKNDSIAGQQQPQQHQPQPQRQLFLLLSADAFILQRSYSHSQLSSLSLPTNRHSRHNIINSSKNLNLYQKGKRRQRCIITSHMKRHQPNNDDDDNDRIDLLNLHFPNNDDDRIDLLNLHFHRLQTIVIASILGTTLVWIFGVGGFNPSSTIAFAATVTPASLSSDSTTITTIDSSSSSINSGSEIPTTRSSSMPVGQKYWSIMDSGSANNNDNKDNDKDNGNDTNNDNANNNEKNIQEANKGLIDYAIGTINSQYYDNSGGYNFTPADFYKQWKDIQKRNQLNLQTTQTAIISEGSSSSVAAAISGGSSSSSSSSSLLQQLKFNSRDDTVHTLKYLVSTLNDPYSKYMTRDELRYELQGSGHDGFLGTGCYVEVPKATTSSTSNTATTTKNDNGSSATTLTMKKSYDEKKKKKSSNRNNELLTITRVSNLPIVTAVAPNSPAERTGIVVGDRIVGIGDKDNFIGWTKSEISNHFQQKEYDQHEYFGVADLTIAKPVYYTAFLQEEEENKEEEEVENKNSNNNSNNNSREIVMGYRSTKVKLPTKAMEGSTSSPSTHHLQGDSVVQYELLTPSLSSSTSSTMSLGGGESTSGSDTFTATASIFDTARLADVSVNSISESENNNNNKNSNNNKVGYIRLTRFSKLSTKGYINAISSLEEDGASSYIIDLRNNYGGVIQEAMLVASSLIDDPHAILCYLLNARGGFTPVDVEQYVIDSRYPGYLLAGSNNNSDKSIVLKQVQKEHPNMFHYATVLPAAAAETGTGTGTMIGKRLLVADNWDPPSSYASIHEQVVKRGIHLVSYDASNNNNENILHQRQQRKRNKMEQHSQKKDIVLLINEGTASSAEMFVAALKDNNRCVAVIGTKSFGKGLIQHTFPMPDGGGLKLTIGEFLRPSLKHVTNISFYDHPNTSPGSSSSSSSELMGGIRPDVYCDSKQGIPGKPQSDLCVSVALDVLEEQRTTSTSTTITRTSSKGNFPNGPDV
jgi:C-terminal processing protease CtpA/Prc